MEDFNNTAGSTAGFTGDFSLATNGANGFLQKDRVLGSAVYTITSPTYQVPTGANSIGFGFTLNGTERIARVEVKILYISNFNGEVVTVFLGQFVPSYDPGTTTADFCRAVAVTDLPGFPADGRYRLRIEVTPNSGAGVIGQTITFDDFRTLGAMSQAPLPVTFIGFEAKKLGGNVLLTWKIAGEENVDRYEVERSDDGRTFRTIASIARHGKDTYTYSDANSNSTAYYRVRNVDNDGKFKYSTIARIVNGKSEIVLKAFPQPVQNQLTLQHPTISSRALISISAADGRVVRSVVPASGSMLTYLDMSNLQKGMYMIRYDGGDGEVKTMKVLKQ